jgi:hypothetical protein
MNSQAVLVVHSGESSPLGSAFEGTAPPPSSPLCHSPPPPPPPGPANQGHAPLRVLPPTWIRATRLYKLGLGLRLYKLCNMRDAVLAMLVTLFTGALLLDTPSAQHFGPTPNNTRGEASCATAMGAHIHELMPPPMSGTAGVGNCSKHYGGQFGHEGEWCQEHLECAWCRVNTTTNKVVPCTPKYWMETCFCSMDPCSLADNKPPPKTEAERRAKRLATFQRMPSDGEAGGDVDGRGIL